MKLALGIAGGIAALGVLWYVKEQMPGIAASAAGALNAVNPLNRDNVIYGAANATAAAIVGEPAQDFSLGAWLYEKTHPAALAAERDITGASSPAPQATAPPALNAWSPDEMAGFNFMPLT